MKGIALLVLMIAGIFSILYAFMVVGMYKCVYFMGVCIQSSEINPAFIFWLILGGVLLFIAWYGSLTNISDESKKEQSKIDKNDNRSL